MASRMPVRSVIADQIELEGVRTLIAAACLPPVSMSRSVLVALPACSGLETLVRRNVESGLDQLVGRVIDCADEHVPV